MADATSGVSKEKAREEKAALPNLFRPRNRPGVSDLVAAKDNSPHPFLWAIPSEFLDEWRRWIRSPGKQPRPAEISTVSILCKHGQMCYNVATDLDECGKTASTSAAAPDRPSVFEFITPDEERALSGFYVGAKLPRVSCSPRGFVSDPPCCEDCHGARVQREKESFLTYGNVRLSSRSTALFAPQPSDLCPSFRRPRAC